jgi:hypothetical protein
MRDCNGKTIAGPCPCGCADDEACYIARCQAASAAIRTAAPEHLNATYIGALTDLGQSPHETMRLVRATQPPFEG